MDTALELIFGGDAPAADINFVQVAMRALIIYVAGVVIVRLGKSRLISRATPLDVILAFILGSLLSRGITGHAPLSHTIVASAALVLIHYVFTALACRNRRFESMIKGHQYPLVVDGDIHRENMRHSHVSDDDLREAARMNGVADLTDVAQAYKERSGEVSIIKRSS
jgi:uncharacterized membrane protein YcaP (DUF421 family)